MDMDGGGGKHDGQITENLSTLQMQVVTTISSAEENVNPLNNNDTVLPEIFSFLSLHDLKAVRSVCRRWHQLAVRFYDAYCSKTTLSFWDEDYSRYTEAGPHPYLHRSIGEMSAFTQNVMARGSCAFRRFEIRSSIMAKGEEEKAVIMSDFLSACGPFVEDLHVKMDHAYEVYLDRGGRLFEQVLPSSPMESLRVLHVDANSGIDIEEFLKDFLAFVTRIIKKSPNIDSLILQIGGGLGDRLITKSIISLLRLVDLNKLTRLEIRTNMTGRLLAALSGFQGLQLKSYRLQQHSHTLPEPSYLRKFLETQSRGLETLSLKLSCNVSFGLYNVNIEFPVMTSLKCLEVEGPTSSCIFTIRNLSYPDQLPKLETLLLLSDLGSSAGIVQFIKPGLSPCLTLQELVLKSGDIDEGIVRTAVSLFPNIRRLELEWHWVAEVYSLLPHLEQLTVGAWGHGGLIDNVITGIPNAECERINREGNYEAVLGESVANVQRTPSITSLPRLRTLKLGTPMDDRNPPLTITDASFHLALFQMESLETLICEPRTIAQISEDCMELSRRRFKIIRQVNNPSSYDSQM